MNRNFLVAFALVAAVLVGAAAVPVTTVAQTNASDATGAAENASGVHVVNQNLGGARLVSWEHLEGGNFRITLASRAVTAVTLMDASGMAKKMSEGSGEKTVRFRKRTVQVGPGPKTIEFSATVVGGAAGVTIADSAIVGIRSGAVNTGGRPAVKWGTVQALLGVAIIGTAAGTYRQVRKRREDDKKEAERVV